MQPAAVCQERESDRYLGSSEEPEHHPCRGFWPGGRSFTMQNTGTDNNENLSPECQVKLAPAEDGSLIQHARSGTR